MEFLSQRGIPFVAKDVSTDMEARVELIALGSRPRCPGLPAPGARGGGPGHLRQLQEVDVDLRGSITARK